MVATWSSPSTSNMVLLDFLESEVFELEIEVSSSLLSFILLGEMEDVRLVSRLIRRMVLGASTAATRVSFLPSIWPLCAGVRILLRRMPRLLPSRCSRVYMQPAITGQYVRRKLGVHINIKPKGQKLEGITG